MLAKRIIPCLDIKDGVTVKGINFEGLRNVGDPVELAARYAAEGADELVCLDISATIEGRKTFATLVERIAEVIDIPFTVGGGIASVEDAGRLLLAGADKVSDADGALSVWERNKQAEKGQKSGSDSVRDVPKVFPAAMRAQKAAKRAAKYGYDFKDVSEAAQKVNEELSELLAAIAEGNEVHISEETGDLLFSAVNVGRLAGADCEESLQKSTQKFIDRFCATETLILADGKDMKKLSADELWAYYERAKKQYDERR